MYTTRQIAELISMQASEWTKTGTRGTLTVIDAVNREMKSGNVQANEYIDTTTGFPPLLSTTSGTYQYDLPDNARMLKSVFFKAKSTYPSSDDYGEYHQISYGGKKCFEVPVTPSRKTNFSNANVIFRSDPGTTTSKYYTAYWVEPTSITSLSVQHDIEPPYELLFIDGCIARIKYMQYGDITPWLQWVERMRIEYWGDMNHNPPSETNQTPARAC